MLLAGGRGLMTPCLVPRWGGRVAALPPKVLAFALSTRSLVLLLMLWDDFPIYKFPHILLWIHGLHIEREREMIFITPQSPFQDLEVYSGGSKGQEAPLYPATF